MKKIFTLFAAALMAAGMYAGNFGMKVNDTYYPGTLNPTPGDPSFTEYMVLDISVEANATLQLWDADNNAGWAVNLDNASVAGIHRDGDHYTCTVAGCYNFYIKIKENNDQLYIGSGSCEGGGQGGGGGTPIEGAKDYYLKGYRGPTSGNIATPTIEEQFESGILADYAFEGDANGLGYFFVLVCDEGTVIGKEYMAMAYSDGTHCTLYDKESTGYAEKLGVPAPSATFYLYDNGDGTLELSTEPLPGKTLVGGGDQAIEHTKVTNKAYKQIIDGQLRIIRGDKMYDATGKEL